MYLVMLQLFTVGGVFAQTINITGVVTEAGGEPVIGGTVVLQGTSQGTVTGIDGSYTISAPSNGVLEFHYVGFDTKLVPVNGRNTINVTLESSTINVDEVVVVAYGTQSRRTVTASISSLNGDALKDIPQPNAESALQGRAAGVSIITPNGAVGQAPVVRVRGVSSISSGTEPLYVVDGVPILSGNTAYTGNVNALADINPADILSMDVLKDAAAAAMYGSRAANGVVLITTRKGRQDKAQVTYNGWVGVTTPSKTIPVMNAAQYVEFKNLGVANRYGTDERSISGNPNSHGNKAYNLWQLGNGSYVDTDWQDYIYQTGLQQNQSVAVSGGSDRIQYYISANYTNQKGMIINDHYDRLGGAANVSAKATNWLKLGINLNATTSNTSYTDQGRKGSQYATGNFSRLAMILPPNVPAYDPETGAPYYEERGGIGYGPNTVDNGYMNPAALIDFGEGRGSDIARVISSYFAEITPISGLILKTQLGIDYTNISEKYYENPFTGDGFGDNGAAGRTSTKLTATTWSNTATYTFNIDKNHFDLLAGFETYEKKMDRWGAYRTDILDTKFKEYQASWSNIYPSAANSIEESSLFSYLGRINYDFDSKYLISLNFRRDGYSALSKNHRWGNFYGASAAWRISQEEFFKPLSHIFTDLKIKGSWGIVGNTNVLPYAAKSYYQSTFYGTEPVYYLSSIADSENLKWESSTKLDIGFTASLFNKVSVEFDFYKNDASDLILDVPVSWSKGIPGNKITTNAGALTNKGIELTVSLSPVNTKSFNWYTSFNITTQANKITKLAEGVDEIRGGNDYNTTVVGKSIGQLFIRETAGIDPETGRRIFIGKNGEQVLAMFDKSGTFFRKDNGEGYAQSDLLQKISGGTLPTYYGGWANDFKYKNFDLSLLLQFSGGNKIFNGSTATLSDMRYWNNSLDVYNNYWKQPGDNAKYAKPIYGDNVSNGSSMPISDWIENGDYLRFKNLTLGYTFNTKNWGKAGINSLRLYASAQNLFILTSYSGLDPESLISENAQAGLQGGVDKNALPQSRVYTFGVNVTF